ncbi:hypothetical protein C6P45_002114, partial [Maudiozyma exigua]
TSSFIPNSRYSVLIFIPKIDWLTTICNIKVNSIPHFSHMNQPQIPQYQTNQTLTVGSHQVKVL